MQGWFNVQKSIHLINHINCLREKNYTIIEIYTEKALDKTKHPLTIYTLSKLGLEENVLDLRRCSYKNLG